MRRSPSRLARRTAPLALALLAACQPQTTRLLMIDERLSDPALLEATARPWHAAGYTVEYRRYYPHLTRADLARYRTVIVLGGDAPERSTDALTLGDVTVLTEWLRRGGVVVLGYPSGEGGGSRDRWSMNQWLAWSDAGITIASTGHHDSSGSAPPAMPVQESDVRELGFESFQAGEYHLLRVAAGAQVLARAAGHTPRRGIRTAVVAARRVGDGLVLVFSRATLGALAGVDQIAESHSPAAYDQSRDFLIAVARWTRRPAEWARVPPAYPKAPLRFPTEPEMAAGGPLAGRAALVAPPPGVVAEVLPRPAAPAPADSSVARAAQLPAWAARQGLRALEGNLAALDHRLPATARERTLDSLADFLEAGAFNVFLGDARGTAIIDSSHWSRWDRDATRAAWDQIAERLDATSARWIPFVTLRDFAADSGFACPLDPRLWENVITPAVRALARVAAGPGHRDVIPAIGLNLSGTPWAGAPFCDPAWQAGLDELTADSGITGDRKTQLALTPPSERYDSLLAGGLLARYQRALERAVARRATPLRAEARRARADLMFAIVTDQPSVDWFTRGLIPALAGTDSPVLLFGPDDGLSRPFPQVLRVVRVDAGRFARTDPTLARRVFRDRAGFWLPSAEALTGGRAQDLVHQLRRFAKDR